jgi:HD-like signal output (HDOD) protein
MEKIASLVILGNSSSNFTAAQSGYDLEEGELWRYSVASALITQDIAEKKRLPNISHLFTSALLKDIGKVVLNTYIKDSFDRIIHLVEHNNYSFTEAEKEIIGFDHAELGGLIAEKWDFNPDMVTIIRNHHDPNKATADDLSIPVVYLADSICMMIGIGVGSDGLSYRYHQDVVDRLKVTEIDMQFIIADFWEKLKSVEELINLSGGKN